MGSLFAQTRISKNGLARPGLGNGPAMLLPMGPTRVHVLMPDDAKYCQIMLESMVVLMVVFL